MGILYDLNKEPLLYFDDEPTGYVYSDAEHKDKVGYFSRDSIYRHYYLAEPELARSSALGSVISANGTECRLENGIVRKISHPFDEWLGYYEGERYGAAAAVWFALLEKQAADSASAESAGTKTDNKSGCLSALIAIPVSLVKAIGFILSEIFILVGVFSLALGICYFDLRGVFFALLSIAVTFLLHRFYKKRKHISIFGAVALLFAAIVFLILKSPLMNVYLFICTLIIIFVFMKKIVFSKGRDKKQEIPPNETDDAHESLAEGEGSADERLEHPMGGTGDEKTM